MKTKYLYVLLAVSVFCSVPTSYVLHRMSWNRLLMDLRRDAVRADNRNDYAISVIVIDSSEESVRTLNRLRAELQLELGARDDFEGKTKSGVENRWVSEERSIWSGNLPKRAALYRITTQPIPLIQKAVEERLRKYVEDIKNQIPPGTYELYRICLGHKVIEPNKAAEPTAIIHPPSATIPAPLAHL